MDGDRICNISLCKPKVGQCGSNLLFGVSHQADKFLVNSEVFVRDSKHVLNFLGCGGVLSYR